eukprot:gene11776-15757_t
MAEERNFESKVEDICNKILKTDSEFWEIKNKAVQQLISLVSQYEDNPDVLSSSFFRMLKEPVKNMISDLRSQQVRDICQFLIKLSQINTGERMKLFLRDIFVNILDGVKVPNKVMSGYVDECVLLLIKYCVFKSAIPLIVTEIKENKAKAFRERCLVYLNEIMETWDVTDKDVDIIIEGLKAGLEDASVIARETARLLYVNVYSNSPRKAEKMKSLLPKPLQAKLTKTESEYNLERYIGIDASLSKSADNNGESALTTRSTNANINGNSNSIIRKTASAGNITVGQNIRSQMLQNQRSMRTNIVPESDNGTVASTDEELAVKAIQQAFRNSLTRRQSTIRNPFEKIMHRSPVRTNSHDNTTMQSIPIVANLSKLNLNQKDSEYVGNYNGNSRSPTSSNTSASKSKRNGEGSQISSVTSGTYSRASPPAKTSQIPPKSNGKLRSISVKEASPTDKRSKYNSNGVFKKELKRTDTDVGMNISYNSTQYTSIADGERSPSKNIPTHLIEGMRVSVLRSKDNTRSLGYIRFIGLTMFSTGVWIGVELDDKSGKNNGTVQNEVYFVCPANRGLFVREECVEVIEEFHSTPRPVPSRPQSLDSPHAYNSNNLNYDNINNNKSLNSSPTKKNDQIYLKQNSFLSQNTTASSSSLIFNSPISNSNSNNIRLSLDVPTRTSPVKQPLNNSTLLSPQNHSKSSPIMKKIEETSQEAKTKFASILKLKLSQLMDLLNQQLEIVEEFEKNDEIFNKAIISPQSSPQKLPQKINLEEIKQEVLQLTNQELELITNFRNQLIN